MTYLKRLRKLSRSRKSEMVKLCEAMALMNEIREGGKYDDKTIGAVILITRYMETL